MVCHSVSQSYSDLQTNACWDLSQSRTRQPKGNVLLSVWRQQQIVRVLDIQSQQEVAG